jgi:hypothetical protein
LRLSWQGAVLKQRFMLKLRRMRHKNQRNIVITGPGRSGTTLTCHLLNKLPDTLALAEPINPGQFAYLLPNHEAVCDGIELFYRDMREMALRQGVVVSKHVGGAVPDNTKGEVDGVRRRIAEKGEIAVGKELHPGFSLAIKEVGMFNALLPTLAKRFRCFAVIRNPLAIKASSLSLQSHRKQRSNPQRAKKTQRSGTPQQRKNPPAIGRYDAGMNLRMEEARAEGLDAVDKWIIRMHLIFERYQRELASEHIIRYEDIVASGGKALEVIVPAARELDEPLESQNQNPLYSRDKVLRYGERLLQSDGAYWNFYSRESVEEILNSLA